MEGQIRVCVIGAGRAGLLHADNFKKNIPGAVLGAIVEPEEEVAKKAAAELEVVCYTNHRQALEDDSLDAYVVVSPTKFHAEIVKDIAKRKKHVLCEKPMAMTVEECDEMMETARANNIKLQIGFMRRFDSGFRRAKDILDSGLIGDVVMVRSNTRGPSVPRPWMYDIRKSNGPLAEVNSHDIDTMRWLTGSEFKTVYAIGGNYRCPEARESWPDFYDNVIMAASFQNGAQGMLDGAQGVGYAYDAHVEVLGTKGCIQIGSVRGDQVLYCSAEKGMGTYPLVNSWRQLFREAYLNEDISFINAIRKDLDPEVTGHDGKMAVQVVNAGNISILEKRIVTL